MPDTTDLDWDAIEDIDFSFGKLPNPANADKHVRLNQAFSQDLYYEETESLFITHKDGTKTLGLDPVTILRKIIIDEIFDCLPSKVKTETTKQHIVALFKFSTMWHIAANGSLGHIWNKATLNAAAQQAIAKHSPVLSLKLQISHWGFKKGWWPCDFMTVYDNQHRYGKSNTREATTVANKTADSSRARFANLLQGKYTKSKAAPPDTTILTVPIKPVESKAHMAIQVPSFFVTPSSATTDLLTNKMIDSDVGATPSNTTASISPVTANLGPLQPVGPIAETPSVKAHRYIWTWTYSPNSESVSFRRALPGSISFQRATSSSPPNRRQDKPAVTSVQRQDKPTVSALPVTPRSGHHSATPWEPTNFRWTFNPQNEIATFRLRCTFDYYHLRHFLRALTFQTPLLHTYDPCNPHAPVLRLSKRHRDALKVKLYHLYANIFTIEPSDVPIGHHLACQLSGLLAGAFAPLQDSHRDYLQVPVPIMEVTSFNMICPQCVPIDLLAYPIPCQTHNQELQLQSDHSSSSNAFYDSFHTRSMKRLRFHLHQLLHLACPSTVDRHCVIYVTYYHPGTPAFRSTSYDDDRYKYIQLVSPIPDASFRTSIRYDRSYFRNVPLDSTIHTASSTLLACYLSGIRGCPPHCHPESLSPTPFCGSPLLRASPCDTASQHYPSHRAVPSTDS
eukprot:jgi/Psemu1/41660/gm1.41660_g